MKKYIITTLLIAAAVITTQAQEFKVAKSSGKLIVNLSSARIEGTTGNEIVFTTTNAKTETDERAKGLRPISGSGFQDNTGLGINVTDAAGTIEVNQVTQRNQNIKILVPKGVSIVYKYDKVESGKVSFKDIESEIEVSTQFNSVELENVTGPLSVKVVNGSVDAKFGANIKGPISIACINGHVDVAIPAATKANLKLSTSHGEILASSDFKIEMEKTTENNMISYSNKVQGKLNGGGTDITLSSNNSKIYLRTN
jgi:hypothetical protein